MKEYLELFLIFLSIGAVNFGGGYAILPLIERELIKKRGWITRNEVMDYFTIAQITPGVIAINVSTFVGYKRKGFAGGLTATLGFILPGISLMILASLFIRQFADNSVIRHAFTGIRIAVGALILSTSINIVKGIFKNYKSVIIFVMAFVLSAVFSTSPVYIVLGAGLAGFFFFPEWRKKEPPENKMSDNADNSSETTQTVNSARQANRKDSR